MVAAASVTLGVDGGAGSDGTMGAAWVVSEGFVKSVALIVGLLLKRPVFGHSRVICPC